MRGIGGGLLGAVLLLAPWLAWDNYATRILNLAGINALLALGLTLLMGFAGQLSLGQAGFSALGAYTAALLAVRLGAPFWLGLPAAGAVAAACALAFGPVLRLRGHFLAMATIAFGEIVRLVLLNWIPVTNGPRGIGDIPPAALGPLRLDTDRRLYYVVLALVALEAWIVIRIGDSRVGRALRAVRDNELAAEATGVPGTRYKALAFTLAGFFAGTAGALAAHLTAFVSPHNFHFDESVKILTMVVVGGIGSAPGAILGAVALTVAGEYLRVFEAYRLIIYSVAIMAILIFLPRGLAGLLRPAGSGGGLGHETPRAVGVPRG